MTEQQKQWGRSKDELADEVVRLGFPKELGLEVAKQLGSPKAMDRMLAYLHYVKPNSAELIVDEMIAILTEIDMWRKKKEAEEANARYNEIHYRGLETDWPDLR